jgi:anti-anti-sigma factor
MLPYRLHSEGEILVIEFVALGLAEGPDLDAMSTRLQEELMRSRSKQMVVDCSRLRFMASRGLGVIVTLARLADQHKGALAVCGLNAQLVQLFRFAGLERSIIITSNRQEALAAIATHTAGTKPT